MNRLLTQLLLLLTLWALPASEAWASTCSSDGGCMAGESCIEGHCYFVPSAAVAASSAGVEPLAMQTASLSTTVRSTHRSLLELVQPADVHLTAQGCSTSASSAAALGLVALLLLTLIAVRSARD